MLMTSLLMLAFMKPAQDVPVYFVKFKQERTLFAADEAAMLTIRLGNQAEKTLKSKYFPDILAGLSVETEGQKLTMSSDFSSKGFYRKLNSLGYGAHKDFRLNLRRYYPEMKPGNVYKVTYSDANYDLTSKNISIVNHDMPDLNAAFVVDTSLGKFTIKLDPDQAPNHSRNFALLTKMAFYRDMIWHRVVPGYVIQTGDPVGNGTGGSGFEMELEKSPFLKHKKYAVGMARGNDTDSATSQFYVCLERLKDLDDGYTIFGKVTSGFDVVAAIGKVPTSGRSGRPPEKPLEDVALHSITIQE